MSSSAQSLKPPCREGRRGAGPPAPALRPKARGEELRVPLCLPAGLPASEGPLDGTDFLRGTLPPGAPRLAGGSGKGKGSPSPPESHACCGGQAGREATGQTPAGCAGRGPSPRRGMTAGSSCLPLLPRAQPAHRLHLPRPETISSLSGMTRRAQNQSSVHVGSWGAQSRRRRSGASGARVPLPAPRTPRGSPSLGSSASGRSLPKCRPGKSVGPCGGSRQAGEDGHASVRAGPPQRMPGKSPSRRRSQSGLIFGHRC